MNTSRALETHLLNAVLKIAKEECANGTWDEVAPALASTWERLREEGTPAWPEVADEVRASCVDAGLVKH